MTRILLILSTLLSFSAVAQPLYWDWDYTPDEYVYDEYVVKLRSNDMAKKYKIGRSFNKVGRVMKYINARKDFMLIQSDLSINELEANDDFEYVEPNYIYYHHNLTNDESFKHLWGLQNIGQAAKNYSSGMTKGKAGVDIHAEQAWGVSTGSEEVIVAVIDTGVDYTHEDLYENIWINDAEAHGQDGVDDDKNGFKDDVYGYNFFDKSSDPMDDHGHGTHCSGTIGARGNNEVGVVGVNWNVRIMALKFLSASGSGTLAAGIEAIDYAAKMGAHIINASWGSTQYSKALEEAIQRAYAAGVLFVAAAGNSSADTDSRPNYPSAYKVGNIIAVAAMSNTGKLARFSNYGETTVHLAAPGDGIYSSVAGEYGWMSGTSMAAPHVAGVAALVLSAHPDLTVDQLKEKLLTSTQKMPSLEGVVSTAGFLDAAQAVQ